MKPKPKSRPRGGVECRCEMCGDNFYVEPWRMDNPESRRFCGSSCRRRHREANPRTLREYDLP